jgi:signal transduction histidine kinase
VVALTLAVFLAAAAARLQAARVASQRREREVARERAIAAERLRIARDLHDLVGHGLSTVAIQSSAARLALDSGDSAAARRAVVSVEAASRGALAEMRQLLGVLRHGSTDAAPAPGLAGIEPVADSARGAGHDVTVHRTGPLDAVPAAAALCAYRVVQEAVTNAVRHAPGAAITVSLRADPDALTIEVTDDGATEGGSAAEAAPDRPRYGLVGLAERVAAAGGTFEAGPRAPDPGWRVVARLPPGEEGST